MGARSVRNARSFGSIARNFAEFRNKNPKMTAEQTELLNYFEECIRAMKKKFSLRPWESFGAVYFGHTDERTFPKFSVRCDLLHGMILEIKGRDALVIKSKYPKNATPEEIARKFFLRLVV